MTETPTRHFVISTAAERSGEISRLKWQKRRPATRHFDESAAEQQNPTLPWQAAKRKEISRLSVSIAPRSLSPYRHVPPLEMTVRQAAYGHFKGANDRNADSPLRHFDRSEAKWRNLTPQMAETLPPTHHFDESRAAKSHFPMVHAHGGRRPVITGT